MHIFNMQCGRAENFNYLKFLYLFKLQIVCINKSVLENV